MTEFEDSLDGHAGVVRLMYAQWGAVEEEMVEPLIAVVGSEAEARRLQLQVVGLWPGAYVSWEELPLVRDSTEIGALERDQVHVVFQGADVGMRDDPAEVRDPIGVAVHSTRASAEKHAALLDDGTQRPYGVRSLPVDYRRHGWPFVSDAQPPLPGEMVPSDPRRGNRYSR